MTVVIFLIVLAVLIFVHELGHFLLARLFGIRVDAFKLGFGPKIFGWKRGETEYGVNAIPFGGYVKIHGENPNDENTHGHDSERSFVNKPRWQQVIVLVAGVSFNFIFAWFLYTTIFTMGVTASVSGFDQYANYLKNPEIMITSVLNDSPAYKAGLKQGDTLIYVETTPMNAKRAQDKITLESKASSQTIEEIQDTINTAGIRPVAIQYMREGVTQVIGVQPIAGIVDGKQVIGISMDAVATLKLPFGMAIVEGFKYTIGLIKETVLGLYTFIENIFGGSPNFSDVTGPIGIAGIVGNAAKLGLSYLLMVTAVISINLGVINLIPFPALDGGRVLFVLIESVIRRRISAKFTNIVNLVGFVLLMVLMVAVTWRDIARIWN